MKVIFYITSILLHRTLFVCVAGPTLNQHWINDLCFTGQNTLKITKRNYPNVTALLDRLLRCWPNITSPDWVFLIFVSRDIPIICWKIIYYIPAVRLTCIACFSQISQSILNRFRRNFARTIFESRIFDAGFSIIIRVTTNIQARCTALNWTDYSCMIWYPDHRHI